MIISKDVWNQTHSTSCDVTHRSARSVIAAAAVVRSEANNVNFSRYFVFQNVMGLSCPTFYIIMAYRTKKDVLKSSETSWTAAADRGNKHTGSLDESVLSV